MTMVRNPVVVALPVIRPFDVERSISAPVKDLSA